MFYTFRQNNSGGSFIGPAITVIIEADGVDDANARAEKLGLYFDGCADGRDCDCCGDRWHEIWRTESGTEVPTLWDEPLKLDEVYTGDKFGANWGEMAGVPNFMVVYKDGSQKVVK